MRSAHAVAGPTPPRPARVASVSCAALALALLALADARPAAAADTWRVAAGEVRVRCRMTVGGSFDAVSSAVSGFVRGDASSAGSYTGELLVDLATLDTGIGLRNDHLRTTYLDTERGTEFRHAVLSGVVLDQPLPGRDGRHETRFSGVLSLHGVQRPIEGEAELRRRNGRMQVEARFSLSLDAFDIPPPRYLGIGVRDAIEVTVRFDTERDESSPDDGS